MDERIQKYEEKMKKTLGSLEAELTTIRAGGKYHCPGSSYDPDPAMGIQPDQGN